jgi:hypothetical protein
MTREPLRTTNTRGLVEQADLWSVAAAAEDEADTAARPLSGEDRRWRAAAIISPIEQLVRSLAHAQITDDRFDVRRLSQHAIDVVVSSQGFAKETTQDDLIDALATLAAEMTPDAPVEEVRDVAARVYRGLLNEQHEYAKFEATAIGRDGVRRPFTFRLLVLRQGEDLEVVASDEAINVFLSALDLDPSDAENAYAAVLERQLEDGRFEAAEMSAVNAGRASAALAAKIAELLDAVRRDVRSVNWVAEARPQIAGATVHVTRRIAEDDTLLAKVRRGTDDEDADVRAASGRIADVVRAGKRLHLNLERRLVGAHEAFLDAQRVQELARRQRLRLLSTQHELLEPVLALPRAEAQRVTDAFAEGALGLHVPRQLRLAAMIDALLAGGRVIEPREALDEDPGDPDAAGPDPQAYPVPVMTAARDVLTTCVATPRRLSALVADARRAPNPEDVAELVWLTALWSFAPEDSAGDETVGTVDALAGGLAALDDGMLLDDPEFTGADLLVGGRAAIEAIQDAPSPDHRASVSADGDVIDLKRARQRLGR